MNTSLTKFFMQMSLELGGNAPFIVFDDADVEVAVKALINTKFRNAGQACIASNRILVQEKIYDEFTDLLVKKVSRMKCGNGMHRDVTVGKSKCKAYRDGSPYILRFLTSRTSLVHFPVAFDEN